MNPKQNSIQENRELLREVLRQLAHAGDDISDAVGEGFLVLKEVELEKEWGNQDFINGITDNYLAKIEFGDKETKQVPFDICYLAHAMGKEWQHQMFPVSAENILKVYSLRKGAT